MVDVVVQPQVTKLVVVGEAVASPVVVESPTTVQVPAPAPREVEVIHAPREVVATTGGIQGPPGEDGDKHFRYVQGTPALQWVVDHDLDKFPAVSIVDSGGTEVEGHVQYESRQRLTITFSAAFAGEAYLN